LPATAVRSSSSAGPATWSRSPSRRSGTRWAAVERFAGADRERAVVEPEARAMLASFDDRVEHREVVVDLRSG
jgi:hypothetical protein